MQVPLFLLHSLMQQPPSSRGANRPASCDSFFVSFHGFVFVISPHRKRIYLISANYTMSCRHPDIRRFDEVRCCLACGEAVFESSPTATTKDMAGSRYQYRGLNYTLGQEIRLIELLPGLRSDDIRCNIVHVNLDDDPEFEAVSYTWATEDGDDTFSKTIYTSNNTTMSVTANCLSALRQLRKLSNVRRLWIDAVCIDQANPSERNHQVAMMTEIYKQAVNVRICIEDLQPRPSVDHPVPRHRDYEPLFEWLQKPSKAISKPRPRGLKHLISLRYFKRVWVIQEVALAKSVYLHVNDREMLFSRAILRYIQSKYPTGGVLSWDTSFKVKADLLTCLRAGLSGQCTDPKDKVYAVLGLMEPVARSLIPINYSLKVEELYAHVAIAVIKIYKEMNILRYTSWSLPTAVDDFQWVLTSYQFGTINRHRDQFLANIIGVWSSDADIRVLSSPSPIALAEDSIAVIVTTQGPMINTYLGNPLPLLQVQGHMIDIVADDR
jgi:hypothetical protein